MKISVNELESYGYHEHGKFHYSELSAFARTYLAKTNVATVFFLVVNILLFALLAVKVALVAKGRHDGGLYALSFAGGYGILLLLIPLHEAIHAIAYKLYGAPRVSFSVNLRKFTFLTVADKFVASRGEFMVVLFAPFTCISILLIILFFTSGSYLQCSFIAALFAHTIACAGDFSLASYFLFHTAGEIVTYDDAGAQVVYFYSKGKAGDPT